MVLHKKHIITYFLLLLSIIWIIYSILVFEGINVFDINEEFSCNTSIDCGTVGNMCINKNYTWFQKDINIKENDSWYCECKSLLIWKYCMIQ